MLTPTIRRYGFLFFGVLFAFSVDAQPAKISVIGNKAASINTCFVGESHIMEDLWKVKYSIVEYLYVNFNINDVVLEYNKSVEYASNTLIMNGDSSLLLEFSDYYTQYRYFVSRLKKLSDENPVKPRIKIHCIDFERIDFVNVLLQVLRSYDNQQIQSTELFNYLNSISSETITSIRRCPVEKRKSRNGIRKLHDKARIAFVNDSAKLKLLLAPADYNGVSDILFNTAGLSYKHRERDMYTALSAIGTNHFVCLVGAFHVSLRNNQSLLSRYVESLTARQNVAIINMICPECSSFHYPGLPKAVVKNESNIELMQHEYNSTTDKLRVVHSSRFSEITPDDTKGLNVYYMFFY